MCVCVCYGLRYGYGTVPEFQSNRTTREVESSQVKSSQTNQPSGENNYEIIRMRIVSCRTHRRYDESCSSHVSNMVFKLRHRMVRYYIHITSQYIYYRKTVYILIQNFCDELTYTCSAYFVYVLARLII